MSSASLPPESRPTWQNWSGNLKHKPPTDGEDYYFAPQTLAELKQVLSKAKEAGVVLRVSGQRHSQPPLVIGDNRGSVPATAKEYLVDLSCYADLGAGGDQDMVLDAANNKLTVNTGVRESNVDAFLTKNNLMMRTVTAGGFFSLGGMTSVDVHGATFAAPIFSGTVSAFTILKADGTVETIDNATPQPDPRLPSWRPIQFARVNLGGLGIVTSVTLDVLPRPYANTLQGGITTFNASSKSKFISEFEALIAKHDRMETFYNPYADGLIAKSYLAAWWNVVKNPADPVGNDPEPAGDTCKLAAKGDYGATLIHADEIAVDVAMAAQKAKILAGGLTAIGMLTVHSQVSTANKKYSDLWLTKAARAIFMSYFIEIGKADAKGLGIVYDALQVVGGRLHEGSDFYIAAPMEFRFITGDDTAMAGTYVKSGDSLFVNLDLVGFAKATPSENYQPELLRFYADVEREWVAMGGFPHNGKMYGFYDPGQPPGTYTGAFNPNYLAELAKRRGERLQAYKTFREYMDPDGLFYNDFLKALLA